MPPLCVHLRIAHDAALALGDVALQRHLGYYLLGSTTPDIRGPLGWPRDRTHFTRLEEAEQGDSLSRMFEALPHLSEARQLTAEAAVFVAGYRSHLIADELWIREVYGPYFGARSPLQGSPMALVWDRALQFDLDNAERAGTADIALWQNRLIDLDLDAGLSLGFLEMEALERWLTTVYASTERDRSWEQFRSLAEGVFIPRRGLNPSALHQFLEALPQALEEVYRHVSREAIVRFQRRATEQTVAETTTYLP